MKIWHRNALINFGLCSVDVAIAIAGMLFADAERRALQGEESAR